MALKIMYFLIISLAASDSHAQAYRCMEKDGKVSFQQTPCETNSRQTELDIKRPRELTADEQRIVYATATGRVTRGMTAAQVRSSWGTPTKINTTVGSYGRYEQWVYNRGGFVSQYVYLENDVVTSIQSPSK